MCASTHMYKLSKLSSNPPAGRLSLSREMSPFPKCWCPSLYHTFGMVFGQKSRKQRQKYLETPNLHESVPQLTKTRPRLELLPRLTKTRPTFNVLPRLTETRPTLNLLLWLTETRPTLNLLLWLTETRPTLKLLLTQTQKQGQH